MKMFVRFRWIATLSLMAAALLLPRAIKGTPSCTARTGQDLQKIILYCTSSGGQPATIHIRSGAKLSVSHTIFVPSNTNILCAAGASINATSAGVPLVSIEKATAVWIDGCTLNGNDVATNGVYLSESADVHLSRLTLGGFSGAPIYGASWHRIEIEHSVFGTPGLGGWQPGNVGAVVLQAQSGASDHIGIHDNRCNGNLSHSSCFKLAASDSSRTRWIEISHNTVVVGDCSLIKGGCANTPGNGDLGIELFSTTTSDDSANAYFTIMGNLVEAENASTGNNAFCISLGGARFGSVTENIAKNCQALGIEIIASSVSVANNTLENAGPISWDANTIPHTDVVVSQNIIVNPVCRGIFLIATPPNSLAVGTIVSNIIRGPIRQCGNDGPPPAGLRIQDNRGKIAGIRIVENALEDVPRGTNGIEAFGGTQIEIERNRFENNHGTALNLAGDGSEFSVRENRFNGNGAFLQNHGTTLFRLGPNFVNGSVQGP